MIHGIGFDLLDVERMARPMSNERFMNRVFCKGEREYINSKGEGCFETAAGIFAAKEAFFKALGTGILISEISFVEVSHNNYGAPYFILHGIVKQKCEEKRLSFHLTITHTKTTAGAAVIAESS